MVKPGRLFVIEGNDCSGKATQSKRLIERLRREDFNCETMSFPRYKTSTGKIVGGPYLGKPEICCSWFKDPNAVDPLVASLYYAADRRAALPEIEGILKSGVHLVLDRFVESNMGHQCGKLGDRKEMFDIAQKIHQIEYGILGLPVPDKVVFLFMPFEVGRELNKGRPGEADGHESNPDHLRNTEQAYLKLARVFDWHRIDCAPDGTIESLRTPEDIAEEVYSVVSPLLSQKA